MPKTILSRDKARSLELTAYFTAVPCRNAHRSERSVQTGECLECRKADQQRWREKNASKVRADRRARYLANREAVIAAATEWRRRNRGQQQQA
jgi:hypothetical protein